MVLLGDLVQIDTFTKILLRLFLSVVVRMKAQDKI